MKTFIFICLIIVGFLLGDVSSTLRERNAAEAAGVAEYALNPKTGLIEFHYRQLDASAARTAAATPQPKSTPYPSAFEPSNP